MKIIIIYFLLLQPLLHYKYMSFFRDIQDCRHLFLGVWPFFSYTMRTCAYHYNNIKTDGIKNRFIFIWLSELNILYLSCNNNKTIKRYGKK